MRLQRPAESKGLSATGNGVAVGEVTVDDAALFLARLDGGAVTTYEATRFATGRKNALRVELNGSLGSVAFDFERRNELEFYDATPPTAEPDSGKICRFAERTGASTRATGTCMSEIAFDE